MFFFGCMKLYDGVIIDGFLCLIMCILSAALLASADNDLNPFNKIFRLVSKNIENVKIFKISIIVTATVYGFCCILMMIGAHLKRKWFIFPYLIIQALVILSIMVLGIYLASIFFHLGHPKFGYFVCLVVLLSLLMSLFFWKTANKAYVKLGKVSSKQDKEIEMEIR